MAYSIEDSINLSEADRENFVIGGGSVYRQFFTVAQKMYITWVHAKFEADTFFPEIDLNVWEAIETENHKADDRNKFDYTFITYRRRS